MYRMARDFQFDVFLSHNQADKLRVWLDERVIQPGDIISLKVDKGLEQSRVLLLCISPNALASGWVALERSTVIHRDPTNAGRRFIPLLLADCELPDTLRRCNEPSAIRDYLRRDVFFFLGWAGGSSAMLSRSLSSRRCSSGRSKRTR